MALSRRHRGATANIWPGFVDAVTSLLMVMTFVLTIFIVVQYVLREEISGQQSELDRLSSDVAGLTEMLGLANRRAAALEAERDDLAETGAEQSALIDALERQGEQQEAAIARFEDRVASLLAERDAARSRVAGLEDANAELLSEAEALNLALAQARDEIDASAEAARLAAARRDALQALADELRAEGAESDARVAELETQLSEEEQARLAEAAAAERLRERLEDSEAELTAMSLRLEEERAEAEDTLTLLAAAQAAEANLDARLTAALLALDTTEAERDAARDDLATVRERSEAQIDETEALLQAALAQEDAAQDELARISEALEAARAARLAFEGDLDSARDRLAEAEAEVARLREDAGREADERDRLAAALQAAQAEAAALEGAEDDRADLRAQLEEALALRLQAETQAEERLTEAERQQALLATARRELQQEQEAAAESQRRVAALNQQVAQLRQQIGTLQSLLDLAEEEDAEAEAQIESLGEQLNAALAREAIEQRRRAELEAAERERLENYQSEFFGRLREVLGDREGVEIVGDRFVFDSEVLFSVGSDELAPGGRAQVAQVAELLQEVSDEIPETIDWVIRVDGHTDDVPLSGFGEFEDNWELSQARALSVVRYMADDLGFPQWRLAPTGFGEYRPVDPRTTPEARARNRRIELKLTER